jgi:DNA-binding HxlR family transcriptional regulator
MMRVSGEFCPYFQRAVELIGRRWTGAVLRALLLGARRFSGLEQAVPEISARALALRLRELEAAGLVARGVDPQGPVRVTYTLTKKGRALGGALGRLEQWAHVWLAPRGVEPHAPVKTRTNAGRQTRYRRKRSA